MSGNEEARVNEADAGTEDGSSEAEATEAGVAGGADETLNAAQARAEENYNNYLRAAAELENQRRRAAQDLERTRNFAIERFATELLNVMDSFELGLGAADEQAAPETLREGMEATYRQLGQVFVRFGIEVVEPASGERFDPELHEAMTVQPSAEVAADQVLTLVQRGYQLNGRLLRPARVIVSGGKGS